MEERINAQVPGWMARAASRALQFVAAAQYGEGSSIWSEIKTIYMDIQHNKCAYCERVLEDKEHGRIEHDLEHYRPKSNVRIWPTAKILRDQRIDYNFATGDARPKGYYWLAYDPLNYATACKTCNSSLKSDYFPIAGNRAPDLADERALAAELPFLIYPISNTDDDPESILTFDGIIPVPVNSDGHQQKRARVTIDFFRLDTREHLRRERARQIEAVFLALVILDSNLEGSAKDIASQFLTSAISASAPHSSCARIFRNVYAEDRLRASEIATLAKDYLATQF
jgi:hypothetical protein